MQTLFKKLAIVDVNDLTKNAVVPNIAEGIDGATAFGYENEYDMISIENMQELPYVVTHTLEIRGLPTSNVTDYMSHFNDPDVDTEISAIGTDGALISLDPVKLEWIEKPSEGKIWKFRAVVKTLPYREDGNGRKGGGLHLGENLLSVYKWADASGDGIANGFSINNFTSPTFSNGDQTLTHPADGTTADFSFPSLLLPYDGEQLTFAIDVNSIPVDGGHSSDIRIEFFDDTDTITTTQSVSFSTTGRKSVSATIPADAVYAKVSLVSVDDGTATGDTDYVVADPSLRVDGNSVYTSY